MILSSHLFDQSPLAQLLAYDPVIQEYRTFFTLHDWQVVEQWQQNHCSRGRTAHPVCAYLKAFLVRLRASLVYTTQLRRFLLNHSLLVSEMGFHLVLDPSQPYGFAVQQTVPCNYWLCEHLRTLDPALLQALLQVTVRALQAEIPGLGETVAFDVRHIYASV